MNAKETMALALTCDRFLAGGDPRDSLPKRVLADLAEATPADWQPDTYGEGELIESFEREVAELLGKEAAVFMPSGTMAQQIALRIWSERRGTKNVAFHPKCHLEIHEQKGYQELHGLHGVLVGNPNRLMTLSDLQAVAEPLAAVLLELPQREIGGVLPTWDELAEITAWVRRQGIPLHMDGARLWECGPYYQRGCAEISALFDTVYVSFYKGLRGISGAVLAGPADFIRESRIWLRRHGGNLIRLWPYVLAARQGLHEKLPRMAEYHAKAVEIAAALAEIPGIELTPNPPHTNMLHVFLKADPDRLLEARNRIARERKVLLFNRLAPSQIPAYAMFELTVVDSALAFTGAEVQSLFEELMG
jgi:threonine aldolase